MKTEPSALRLYKQQEQSINSIPAVKDIAIYEHDSIAVMPYDAAACDVSSIAPIVRLSRGEALWPRRIEFAEQIADINNIGGHVWAVNLYVSSSALYSDSNSKSYAVSIKRIEHPYIVASESGASGLFPQYKPVQRKQLSMIDVYDEQVFFYMCSYDELFRKQEIDKKDAPWDVWSCGVVPNPMTPFNATFYDREVAHLYAESLREETRRIDKLMRQ